MCKHYSQEMTRFVKLVSTTTDQQWFNCEEVNSRILRPIELKANENKWRDLNFSLLSNVTILSLNTVFATAGYWLTLSYINDAKLIHNVISNLKPYIYQDILASDAFDFCMCLQDFVKRNGIKEDDLTIEMILQVYYFHYFPTVTKLLWYGGELFFCNIFPWDGSEEGAEFWQNQQTMIHAKVVKLTLLDILKLQTQKPQIIEK